MGVRGSARFGEIMLRQRSIRLIFDPLGQLDVRVRSDLTLTGVDRAEALVFEFDPTPPDGPAPGAGTAGTS